MTIQVMYIEMAEMDEYCCVLFYNGQVDCVCVLHVCSMCRDLYM